MIQIRSSRAAALALLLVAGFGLSGCSISLGQEAARDADTQEVTEAGDADVFEVRVGDCFDDQSGNEISEIPAVPCAEPHDNEAYYVFDMADGEFSDADVTAAADETCLAEFEGFIGKAYDESEADWFPITPTEGSWSNGDREIVCAAYVYGEKLTGTLKGSGR